MSYSRFQEAKKERIENLEDAIKDEAPIKRSKAEAEASLRLGISRDKAEEYVQDLIDAERIRDEENDAEEIVLKVPEGDQE